MRRKPSTSDSMPNKDDHFDGSEFDTSGAMKTLGSFNVGDTYFVATTLHAGGRKSVIFMGKPHRPERHTGRREGYHHHDNPKFIKFKWSGREHIFLYHQAKKPNHAMLLSKFFSTENPLSGMEGYSPDVKFALSQGKLTIGMTMRQALLSKRRSLQGWRQKDR